MPLVHLRENLRAESFMSLVHEAKVRKASKPIQGRVLP